MRSFRFVTTAFSAAALVALLAGCGTTTSPTAVTPGDTTSPSAPTSLSYSQDRTGATLTWAPSTSGNVNSYVIFMYQPDPSQNMAFVQVGTSLIAAWGVPVQYQTGTQYFRIQAVNNGGNHSADSAVLTVTFSNNQAGNGPNGGGSEPRTD